MFLIMSNVMEETNMAQKLVSDILGDSDRVEFINVINEKGLNKDLFFVSDIDHNEGTYLFKYRVEYCGSIKDYWQMRIHINTGVAIPTEADWPSNLIEDIQSGVYNRK